MYVKIDNTLQQPILSKTNVIIQNGNTVNSNHGRIYNLNLKLFANYYTLALIKTIV